MKKLIGAAILAGALFACGDHLATPESPSVTPVVTPTATATLTPTDPPKTDPTYAPAVPPIRGIHWLYVAERKTPAAPGGREPRPF